MFRKNFILLNIKSLCQTLFFTQNINEIKNFFKNYKKIILKPIHSYSGNDIHLLDKFDLGFIQKFIKKT